MAHNNFSSPYQKSTNWILSLWIPLLLPVAFFLVDDYVITSAFIMPLMLFLLISCLAFRLPAWQVASWSAIYAVFLFTLLQFPSPMTNTAPFMVPYMRTAGFIVAGTVATLLASHRARLMKSRQALFSVISVLPVAVIVSDILGNILLLNMEAEKVLRGRINALSGLSYFSTFISPHEQGAAIAKYVSYFDPHHVGPVQMVLRMRDKEPLTLHASLIVVGLDKSKYAVTVIEKVEESVGVAV